MTENTDTSDNKLYYPIGDVAKMFNTTVSNIRYWEKEFDILRPKKNKKGDRFFTRKDLDYLKLIHHLLREKGYTIEGARKKLESNPDESLRKMELVTSLKEIRSFLASLKSDLER